MKGGRHREIALKNLFEGDDGLGTRGVAFEGGAPTGLLLGEPVEKKGHHLRGLAQRRGDA